MSDWLPASDEAAERAVLGACLLEGAEAYDRARATGLRGSHFYRPAHEILFDAMGRLTSSGSALDWRLLGASLSKEERRTIGPPTVLAELLTEGALIVHLEAHASSIISAATLRELQTAGIKIHQLASTAPLTESREVLEAARAALDGVDVPEERESIASAGELVTSVMDEMESEKPRGIRTGFPDLDHLLGGGLGPGQSIVIGARPSVGKSMLGVNLAAEAASLGIPTVMFSHEMTKHELMQRILARASGVHLTKIRTGSLNDADWNHVSRAFSKIHDWPLFIDDAASMQVADYRARLRKLEKRRKVGLVVSDYIQLIKPEDPKVSREQQVAGISAGLKAISKDFHLPFVVLAQLSRATEQRRDARPVMSDLRESGAIENDADVVMLMHKQEDGGMDLDVVKNRQGECGRVELAWNAPLMRASPRGRY